MEELPARQIDRIAGKKYLSKGKVKIWDGRILKCEHNNRVTRCKICNGNSICVHNKRKRRCKKCNGTEFCKHGKSRYYCQLCGGSQTCIHQSEKSKCKLCKGSQICEHNNVRAFCRKCDGSQICPHKKRKDMCKLCKGNNICIHNTFKFQCHICYPIQALTGNLRGRIYKAIQGTEKTEKTMKLLGCNIEEFRDYIESLFIQGMSWSNRSEWHIDHRKPCSTFNLQNEKEQKMCFHYTNLQPMWKSENLSKGARFIEEDFDRIWTGSMWIEKT